MDAAQHTFEAWLASLLAERLEDASIEFVVRNVGDVRRQYVPVHSLALGHFRFAYVSACLEVNLASEACFPFYQLHPLLLLLHRLSTAMAQGKTKGLTKKAESSRHAQKAAAATKKGKRAIPPKKAAAVKQAALHKVCSFAVASTWGS